MLETVRAGAADALAEGAFIVAVPRVIPSGEIARVNLSFDSGVLAAIDAAAAQRLHGRSRAGGDARLACRAILREALAPLPSPRHGMEEHQLPPTGRAAVLRPSYALGGDGRAGLEARLGMCERMWEPEFRQPRIAKYFPWFDTEGWLPE